MEIKVRDTDSAKVRKMVKRIKAAIQEIDPVDRSGSDGKTTTTTLTVREDGIREVSK